MATHPATAAAIHHVEQHGRVDLHALAAETAHAAAEHVLGILQIDAGIVALSLAVKCC